MLTLQARRGYLLLVNTLVVSLHGPLWPLSALGEGNLYQLCQSLATRTPQPTETPSRNLHHGEVTMVNAVRSVDTQWVERLTRKYRTPAQKWADEMIEAGNARGRAWRKEFGHMSDGQLVRRGEIMSAKAMDKLLREKKP